MSKRLLSLLSLLLLLGLSSACGPAELGFAIERRGLYYFTDLPYGFSPSDGYWHRDYCWYDGYWYYQGRGTPYYWDYGYEDPWYW